VLLWPRGLLAEVVFGTAEAVPLRFVLFCGFRALTIRGFFFAVSVSVILRFVGFPAVFVMLRFVVFSLRLP
jgi:hypothetical protein